MSLEHIIGSESKEVFKKEKKKGTWRKFVQGDMVANLKNSKWSNLKQFQQQNK